jgi:predicted PolB exonuclease-like 3'-5' exonuclease
MSSAMLEHILFLDIETVASYPAYDDLPEAWKELWAKKVSYIGSKDQIPSEIYDRAAIYAEFGKIICISVAFLTPVKGKYQLRVKSFYGHDESVILKQFSELLNGNYYGDEHYLCAHNGKEFDFPYLGRRLLANRLALPNLLQLAGKKPWEVRHLDTMQLWKFGDFKSYTSLDLLAAIFDIPTPKDDIDGSMVREVYYADGDVERIKVYCEKDVITLANVLLKMMGKDKLDDKDIFIAEA